MADWKNSPEFAAVVDAKKVWQRVPMSNMRAAEKMMAAEQRFMAAFPNVSMNSMWNAQDDACR